MNMMKMKVKKHISHSRHSYVSKCSLDHIAIKTQSSRRHKDCILMHLQGVFYVQQTNAIYG